MTYRDDHEAAVERAAALESELERTEADRKRAEAERDRLAAELARVRGEKVPAREIVVVPRAPLAPAEVDALVGELHSRALAAQHGANTGLGISLAVSAIAWVATIAVGGIELFVLTLSVSAMLVISAVLRKIAARPESWQPVIAALREDPERIIRVIHRERVSRYRVHHRLAIETGRSELVIRGNDWKRLYDQLQRLCPRANFDA